MTLAPNPRATSQVLPSAPALSSTGPIHREYASTSIPTRKKAITSNAALSTSYPQA